MDYTNQLADIVARAKGDRSARQYSKDSNVSQALISRTLQGGYRPSAKIIRKLTDPKAKPQGGVTYEEMMAAAGYLQIADALDEAVRNALLPSTQGKEKQSDEAEGEDRSKLTLYESVINGFILEKMRQKNFHYAMELGSQIDAFDLILFVDLPPIKHWCFDIYYISEPIITPNRWLFRILGKVAATTSDCERKVSVVINDEKLFSYIKKYQGKISYRGDLSVILVKLEDLSTEEFYLSHFDEEEYTEFFLS